MRQATEIDPRLRTVAEGYAPMESKPRVKARLLELLNYGPFWAARLLLLSEHPVLGNEAEVRTSKLVRIDFAKGELETLNTLYEFGA